MPGDYKTLKRAASDEFIVNKSRFIGYASPCQTEEEALAFLKSIREKHRDATHNCYAYVIGENAGVMRYSDDGEPGGPAGLPMMEVLKARGVVNCCVVVTRYFGGVKLGTGGLVRAYSGSVAHAVEAAGLAQEVKMGLYVFSCAPGEAGKITNLLYQQQLFVLADTEYGNAVTFILRMPEDRKLPAEKWLTDTLQKTIELTEAGFEYEEVPV